MQQVEVIRRFEGGPEKVWGVYTEHAGWSRWAGCSTSRVEKAGAPDPNGPGCVRVLGTAGVNAVEEVLDFEPPRRMTYRLVRGGLPLRNHRGEVLFLPDGEGTRVEWRCWFDSPVPGLGAPLRWFVTGFFRRALDGLARSGLAGR